jgi:hypothetical protein
MTITQTNPRNYAPSVRAIEDSWTDQAATAGTYQFLGDIALEDLHDHFLHSASAEEKDRILYALLSESAAGDDLATLTVVRLFIAKAVRLARSCTALRSLPHTEAVSCSIAAFWEAARAYPLHRKSKTAANLYLNAMEIIDRQRVAGAEVFLAQDALDWAVERGAPTESNADQDLAEVLMWALEKEALSRDVVALMSRYYLAPNPQSLHTRATELGLSKCAFQKRASRIRLKLIAAVRQHVQNEGTW